eukprot:9054131-Prorocentrum_lima.AAC.1
MDDAHVRAGATVEGRNRHVHGGGARGWGMVCPLSQGAATARFLPPLCDGLESRCMCAGET